jgi:hypothetical protein
MNNVERDFYIVPHRTADKLRGFYIVPKTGYQDLELVPRGYVEIRLFYAEATWHFIDDESREAEYEKVIFDYLVDGVVA